MQTRCQKVAGTKMHKFLVGYIITKPIWGIFVDTHYFERLLIQCPDQLNFSFLMGNGLSISLGK